MSVITLPPVDPSSARNAAVPAAPLPCQPVPDSPDESWLDELADSLARTRYSLACWFRQDEVPLPL